MINNVSNYNFVFCGSSHWSAAILKSLIDNNLSPSAVITKTDKASGRGQKISTGALKDFSEKIGISNYQVKNKLEFFETIKKLQPDFVIVVDFGIIITQEALDVAKFEYINIHPSLLPKYRGTSPIQTAILNGDKETGVSIMKLDADIDHGPIYWQKSLEIEANDTYNSLLEKLLPIASQGLLEVINRLDDLTPSEQDHAQAIFTQKITNELAQLDLNKPSEYLFNLIRATNPKPGAWLMHKDKRIKIYASHISDTEQPKQFNLKCGDGKYLVVDQLQPEGKKIMTGKDYLNGIK